MKVIAIVQARMGSSRFAGKSLRLLNGKPVLQWVLDRVRRAHLLTEVVVATSQAAADDILANCCRDWRYACHRGSEDDVLGRFIEAAAIFRAERVVRVNADNPLIDPAYIDALVSESLYCNADYASYRRNDGTPVMLTALSFFAEIVTSECLRRAGREILDVCEREHVTLGIYRRPEQFSVRWLDVPWWCDEPRMRLTVDTPADLDTLAEVVSALGDRADVATAEEVVRVVRAHPAWLATMADRNVSNSKKGLSS